MSLKNAVSAVASLLLTQLSFGQTAQDAAAVMATQSPIKHVIIIVGENRSFDHVFATYKPRKGQTVDNLLSKGIIKENGSPGPNYSLAAQFAATVTHDPSYDPSPRNKTLYYTLPTPLAGGPTDVCVNNGICTLADATSTEDGLAIQYYPFMLSGGTGLTGGTPDTRISGVFSQPPYSNLPSGPFQLTNSLLTGTFPYDAYANSPVHRFYQMWQQMDCSAGYATPANPSGCKADLFPWVEVTVGANINGVPQPSNFSTEYGPGLYTTGEGATSMAFYNVLQGDAPYLKLLADTYAISDNYHQPMMGGTGANSIMLGFGDAIWFSDGNGHPAVPPHNQLVWAGGPVDEIENPNPVPGTNNWWTEDGYGGFGNSGSSIGVYGGGSYSDCSDSSAPGVGAIRKYLASLATPIRPNCDPNHYYLLNNYNPGYFGDGSNAYTDTNSANTPFTIPPTNQHSIADVLAAANVPWAYYGDQWNNYLTDKYQLNYGAVGPASDEYCNICNPFQYQTSVMTNPAQRANLQDTANLYAALQSGILPAVSFVKPSGWVDGHPASSKLDLFEGFVQKVVDAVRSNPELWKSTAIFITVDEGGGYYDSGYVQPLDFFGDGTRIPLLVVSAYSTGGAVSHAYSDHVSILKFIERNWNLGKISGRSRDNLPNPAPGPTPYVPANSPAISDLFDMFQFGS